MNSKEKKKKGNNNSSSKMHNSNKTNNSLEDKTIEEIEEEELEPGIQTATAKVVLKTVPWEESASMRRTLCMLGR